MEQTKMPLGKGLNSHQIKLIAVIAMTIDHLGAYGFEIPIFDTYNAQLRLIGRIAMPLFLFILTESVRHTRSRQKFLLRLYLAAVGCGLFVAVTNFLFGDTVGMFVQSNIFFTYFYVALYITLIEEILAGRREKDSRRILIGIGGIAATAIPHILLVLLDRIDIMSYAPTWELSLLISDLVQSFLASPIHVEYTFLYVILGILMYFAGNKYRKAAVLVAFGVGSYLVSKLPAVRASLYYFVLGYPQYYMVLAAPIMLFYNGEKGKGSKYFFYAYYPLHRYAISVAVYIYQMFTGG